jgi:hypothetical protein
MIRLPALLVLLAIPGVAQDIAFVSDRDGLDDIFVMDFRHGSTPVKLTSMKSGQVFCPSWTPDGKSIIYYYLAEADENSAVYTVDVNGGDPQRIAPLPGIYYPGNRLSLSPDGLRLLYESRSRILICAVGDSLPVDLGEGYYPTWTHDGRIMFTRQAPDRLFVMNSDGSSITQIDLAPPDVQCYGYLAEDGTCQPFLFLLWELIGAPPSYIETATAVIKRARITWSSPSPNGYLIAVVYFLDVSYPEIISYYGRFIVFDTARNRPVPLAGVSSEFTDAGHGSERGPTNTAACFPSWSPDGSRLAFTEYRHGNFDIVTINADGTVYTNLTNHPANDWQPVWAPKSIRTSTTSCSWGKLKSTALSDTCR